MSINRHFGALLAILLTVAGGILLVPTPARSALLTCHNALLEKANLFSSNPWHDSTFTEPLPERFQQMLAKSPGVLKLRSKYGTGKDLKFKFKSLDVPGIESGDDWSPFKGEAIYAHHLSKIIKVIFPEAKIEALSKSERAQVDSARDKSLSYIWMNDRAEEVLGEAMELELKPMFDIAKIKTIFVSECARTKISLRQALGLPLDSVALSFYFDSPGLRIKGLEKGRMAHFDFGSEITPSYESLVHTAVDAARAKVVFLSFGQRNESLWADIVNTKLGKFFDHVVRLSGLIKEPSQLRMNAGESVLILNDTIGHMSQVTKAADLHLIRGPIFLFGGINNGVPSVSFNNYGTAGNYNSAIFQKMLQAGLASDGLINVENMKDLPDAIKSQLRLTKPIRPIYAEGTAIEDFVEYFSIWLSIHIEVIKSKD